MITWFQIGLTSGPIGNYIVQWGEFNFYTGGNQRDYIEYMKGRTAAKET